MSKYVERTILSSEFEDEGFLERVHEHVKVSLRKCPCCGKPAKVEHVEYEDEEYLIVECPYCGFHTARCTEYEEAAEMWNKRRTNITNRNTEILSCPLCGGKAEAGWCDEDLDFAEVECTKCGAKTAAFTNAKAAIKVWNRRV